MPWRGVAGLLTDIGTEELAHLEIVAAIVHQLTRNLSMEEIEKCGFANYYVDHTVGVWPQAASGFPFPAAQFQVTGDPITDLMEDMAAEQKARTTYDNILRLVKEPDVCEPIKFLRMREIVHFQRFGEALRITQDKLDSRNFYAFNPAFDRCLLRRALLRLCRLCRLLILCFLFCRRGSCLKSRGLRRQDLYIRHWTSPAHRVNTLS